MLRAKIAIRILASVSCCFLLGNNLFAEDTEVFPAKDSHIDKVRKMLLHEKASEEGIKRDLNQIKTEWLLVSSPFGKTAEALLKPKEGEKLPLESVAAAAWWHLRSKSSKKHIEFSKPIDNGVLLDVTKDLTAVVFKSTPTGAAIYTDDSDTGESDTGYKTDAILFLLKGTTYKVRMKLDGHEDYKMDHEVKAGLKIEHSFKKK